MKLFRGLRDKQNAKPGECIAEAEVMFSYCQLLVADVDGEFSGEGWRTGHVERGVTLGRSLISFGFEGGEGDLKVRLWWGPYMERAAYDRAIMAPLEMVTGKLTVCPPDEFPGEFHLKIGKGHYAVTAAVRAGETEVDLFLEPRIQPLTAPALLIGNDQLRAAWAH